jgi:hypothetical protein
MSKLKEIPTFKNEDEEREFWANNSFTDYLDPKNFKRIPAPMTPKTHDAIFLRMTHTMSSEVERLSKEKKISVEEMIRQLLSAGLSQQGIGHTELFPWKPNSENPTNLSQISIT